MKRADRILTEDRPARSYLWTLLGLIGVAVVHGALWWAGANISHHSLPDMPATIPCISYDPHHALEGFTPKKPQEISLNVIEKDISFLAEHTTCVRIYTTHEGMSHVPAVAARHGITVWAGAWLDAEYPKRSAADVEGAIALANAYENVTKVVIGNESLFFEAYPKERLKSHLKQAQDQTKVPVTYAEIAFVWQANPDLLPYVDEVMIHEFPFWGGFSVDGAAERTLASYRDMQAFTQKPVVLGEVGWPSAGNYNKKAVATPAAAAQYHREWAETAVAEKVAYNVIEAFDQPWKITTQEGRSGPHFGLWKSENTGETLADYAPVFTPAYPLSGRIPLLEKAFPRGMYTVLVAFALSCLLALAHKKVRLRALLGAAVAVHIFTIAWGLVWATLAGEYMFQTVGLWAFVLPPQVFLTLLLFYQLNETLQVLGDKPVLFPPLPAVNNVNLPFISIHVPCCNENPEMVLRTVRSLVAMEYPSFEVIVLSNNTPNPTVWQSLRDGIWALNDPRVRFHHAEKVTGFKAGALNVALEMTDPRATVVGVVDADYIVEPHWLRSTVPHFTNENVAVVQSPQAHFYNEMNPRQTAMNDELDGFFVLGMVQRFAVNALIQHGTMTLIRRSALREASDWSTWCICEDAELGLKLLELGYRIEYMPEVMGRGQLPSNFEAYEKQRYRWAYGGVSILKRHWRSLLGLKKGLSWRQRYEFVFGWLGWVGDALYPFFTLLGCAGLMMVLYNYRFLPPWEFFVPMLLHFVFRATTIFGQYKKRTGLSNRRIVRAMAMGASLTNGIALGVYRALLGLPQAFERTDKTGADGARVSTLWSFLWQRYDVLLSLLLLLGSTFLVVREGFVQTEALVWWLSSIVLFLPSAAVVWAHWGWSGHSG